MIQVKFLVRVAAAVTAVGTIVTFVYAVPREIKPIVDSGPLPLASRLEVQTQIAAVTSALQAIQQHNAKQAQEDKAQANLLILTRQQLLQSLLLSAQIDYHKSPSNSNKIYMCGLIDQIDQLRRASHLPTIPPC